MSVRQPRATFMTVEKAALQPSLKEQKKRITVN
jgi:hypothetical protein